MRRPGRARQRLRDRLVIERGPLLLRVGVDDDELVAALDGFAVPEAMRVADRCRRAGDLAGGRLVLVAQAHRARIVSRRALREGLDRQQDEKQRERQKERESFPGRRSAEREGGRRAMHVHI